MSAALDESVPGNDGCAGAVYLARRTPKRRPPTNETTVRILMSGMWWPWGVVPWVRLELSLLCCAHCTLERWRSRSRRFDKNSRSSAAGSDEAPKPRAQISVKTVRFACPPGL